MSDVFDVYLRPLRIEDAKVSYRWRNDPEVWKNTGSAPNCRVSEAMETAWLQKCLQDTSAKRYAICLTRDDRYIGNIYLSDIHDGSAEEQIFIGVRGFWGKGFGTQARSLVYSLAKEELHLCKIETNIRARNIASLKSVLKLGFVEAFRDMEWVKLYKIL